MSESEQPREPLSPQTHMQIVASSKNLIATLVAADEEKGVNPITLTQEDSPSGEKIERPLYDLIPRVSEGWRGQFFKIPEDVPVTNLAVWSSADRSDPQQFISISADFFGAKMELPTPTDDNFGAYHAPHQQVYIPLSEAVPATAGVTESAPITDDSVKHEGQLDEASAQALLADLNDIIAMQQAEPQG